MRKAEILTVAVLATVIAYFASPILIPFFLALFLAMFLDPVVVRLDSWGLPRRWGAVLVSALFIAIAVATLFELYRSVTSLAIAPDLDTRFGGLTSAFDRVQTTLAGIPEYFRSGAPLENVQKVQLVNATPAWAKYLVTGAGSFFAIVSLVCFVPMLLVYLLADKDNLLESFNGVMGPYVYLPRLNRELPRMTRAYFSANLFAGIVQTVAIAALLLGLGFENWLPIGILAGCVNLVPLVGLPASIVLPVAYGSLAGGEHFPIVWVVVGIGLVHAVANNLLLPLFAGAQVAVNTGAMILGLLFWGWLWGATGFLLAIPMTCILKIFLESNPKTHPWANLMSSRPKHVIPGSLPTELTAGGRTS